MKIDRYNSYIKESVHNLTLDTISEYLMELTDIGYILKTSNIFISDTSKSSKEIKSKISFRY